MKREIRRKRPGRPDAHTAKPGSVTQAAERNPAYAFDTYLSPNLATKSIPGPRQVEFTIVDFSMRNARHNPSFQMPTAKKRPRKFL